MENEAETGAAQKYRGWQILLAPTEQHWRVTYVSPYDVEISITEKSFSSPDEALLAGREAIDECIASFYPEETYPPPVQRWPLPGQPEGDIFAPGRVANPRKYNISAWEPAFMLVNK